MPCREGPFIRIIDITVLHRIVVNVIHVRLIILFIPDRMFPKPLLPDIPFTFPALTLDGLRQAFGEPCLDEAYAG